MLHVYLTALVIKVFLVQAILIVILKKKPKQLCLRHCSRATLADFKVQKTDIIFNYLC